MGTWPIRVTTYGRGDGGRSAGAHGSGEWEGAERRCGIIGWSAAVEPRDGGRGRGDKDRNRMGRYHCFHQIGDTACIYGIARWWIVSYKKEEDTCPTLAHLQSSYGCCKSRVYFWVFRFGFPRDGWYVTLHIAGRLSLLLKSCLG